MLRYLIQNYLLIVYKIYPQPKVVQDNGILISHVTLYALKNIIIYRHVPSFLNITYIDYIC